MLLLLLEKLLLTTLSILSLLLKTNSDSFLSLTSKEELLKFSIGVVFSSSPFGVLSNPFSNKLNKLAADRGKSAAAEGLVDDMDIGNWGRC